jgi:hypothetical protein
VRPGDRAVQHGRDGQLAGRHDDPAGDRQADHDHVEGHVDDLGGDRLPSRLTFGMRRRLADQPPGQARQAEQQDRDADRLVQLEDGVGGRPLGLVAHPPAQDDLEEDGGGDQPVQDDRHGRVALAERTRRRGGLDGRLGGHGRPRLVLLFGVGASPPIPSSRRRPGSRSTLSISWLHLDPGLRRGDGDGRPLIYKGLLGVRRSYFFGLNSTSISRSTSSPTIGTRWVRPKSERLILPVAEKPMICEPNGVLA